MKTLHIGLLFLISSLLVIAPNRALAQTSGACPQIIATALEAAETYCLGTGRNTICYGNILGEATPIEDVDNFIFEREGDVVSLYDLNTLTLSPMDTNSGTWGVALMQMQANLPDTIPNQNVTFLIFGDVYIENATDTSTLLETTITTRGRVRSAPNPDNPQNVIGAIDPNTPVVAYGRDASGRWARIRYGLSGGWVSVDVIRDSRDISDLPIVADDAPHPPSPMQAFYFRTGISDKPCVEAPDSGLLIQSPQGVRGVTFTANGVEIGLGSTAYLRFGEGELKMSVVEGAGYITAHGVTQPVPEGTFATVPMDETGLAPIAPPNYPIPYNFEAMLVLPVAQSFFRTQIIVPTLPEEEIPPAIETILGNAPALSGIYTLELEDVEADDVALCPFATGDTRTVQLEFIEGGIRTTGMFALEVFIPQIDETSYAYTYTPPTATYRDPEKGQYTLAETQTITVLAESINTLELILVSDAKRDYVSPRQTVEALCTAYWVGTWYAP